MELSTDPIDVKWEEERFYRVSLKAVFCYGGLDGPSLATILGL